jgi:peroxiredoxin
MLLSKKIFISIAFLLFSLMTLKAQMKEMHLKQSVERIALKTIKGNKISVDLNKEPLTVLVFLSPECPLCKNYSVVLNKIAEKHPDKLQLLGIVPGKAYSNKEVKHFIKEYKLQFPVLIDPSKELSNTLKAKVTPEVIAISNTGEIIYGGAIDDWVRALGQKTIRPENHYLDDAISKYLNGEPVFVKQTVARGCFINEF